MGDTYIINGPTTIGDEGQLNTILGNVSLANITVNAGDMVYADTINNLVNLARPGQTSVMLFDNGSGNQPIWLPSGQPGEVLTVTGTNIIGWSNSNNEASSFGFSANKANLLSVAGVAASTATNITGWTTTGTPLFDNTAGAFDSNGGVFTVSSNGIYLLNFGVQFLNALNSGDRTVQFIRNGGVFISRNFQPTGTTAIPQVQSFSDQFRWNTGDTIRPQFFRSPANAGENLRITAGNATFWSVAKMANQ